MASVNLWQLPIFSYRFHFAMHWENPAAPSVWEHTKWKICSPAK